MYVTAPEDYEREGRPEGRQGKCGILLERTKTTKAGDYLECEIYPVIAMDNLNRGQRRQKSREAMEKANRERARRKLERLMNANFGPGDLLLHLTMAKPCEFSEFQRLVRNYIGRLKYRAKARKAQLKYIYVIETTGEGERERHHVHMVLSVSDKEQPRRGCDAAGENQHGEVAQTAEGRGCAENREWISRDEAEGLWRHGLARADRCQAQEKGLAGFARYITARKETQHRLMKRSWGASKNLKQPTVTVADRKFSRAAADRIARDVEGDAKAVLEKKYPGYRLIEEPRIRWSDFLPGCYIYAMMVKK